VRAVVWATYADQDDWGLRLSRGGMFFCNRIHCLELFPPPEGHPSILLFLTSIMRAIALSLAVAAAEAFVGSSPRLGLRVPALASSCERFASRLTSVSLTLRAIGDRPSNTVR